MPTQAERLDRARALVPALRERAHQANQDRRTPQATIDDYWKAELFGILKPKKFGGQEARFDDFLAVAGELGRGDGSAAWVYAVIAVHELMLALYPESVQAEVWSDPKALLASSFAPGSQPQPETGGFRVSGQWSFCSGVDNAQWMILGGMFGMTGTPPHPDVRFMIVPIKDCTIVDDWHVMGLRGTGSKSVALRDVFVPAERVVGIEAMGAGQTPGAKVHSGRIYSAPIWAVFPFCLSSAAAGIGRGGLEQFIEAMKSRTTVFERRPIAQLANMHARVAEASALIDAAELLYKRSARETIDKIEKGEPLSLEHRLRSRRDQAYSVVMATRALELLHRSTGGRGLYDNDPVQRHYRDLQAMGAHIAVTWDPPAGSYGSVVLGGQRTDFIF